MCLNTVCLHCLWKPEEDITFPETEITDACEPLCGCQELNPDSVGTISALNQ